MKMGSQSPVAVIAVALPAQGHLNQMLQLSCLISSYGLPVFYAGSAIHNRQARLRINALNPDDIARIHFHDFPTPPFLSPPPKPTSTSYFPTQLQPAMDSTLNLRGPFAAYLQETARKFKRVVVVHDSLVSYMVQDVAQVPNAESYEFVCISAFSAISIICGLLGLPFPLPHPRELPPFEDWMSDEVTNFVLSQKEPSDVRSGNIYNTSSLMEAPYLEVLGSEEFNKGRPIWAVGPILPKSTPNRHECLEWLDKQEPRSVMYVCFGTTVSLSDEEVKEVAEGLERSGVKYLWVLRDADRSNVFDGEVRRAELPEGFGEKEGRMIVREWAPQPQILGHPSVGGFMSHCGWNSCIESITAGVAIAAWPMHSDQPINAALVADILKTGIVAREWKDRSEGVKAGRIENGVRRLMASDEIRKRAEEMGAALRQATEAGGESRLHLESFIAHINRSE